MVCKGETVGVRGGGEEIVYLIYLDCQRNNVNELKKTISFYKIKQYDLVSLAKSNLMCWFNRRI